MAVILVISLREKYKVWGLSVFKFVSPTQGVSLESFTILSKSISLQREINILSLVLADRTVTYYYFFNSSVGVPLNTHMVLGRIEKHFVV